MRFVVSVLTPLVLSAALAVSVPAQSPAAPIVRVHAVAVNGSGEFLVNLPREAFSLLEGDEARPIETFAMNAPASVVFVVDTTGSMQEVTRHDAKSLYAAASRAISAFAARRTAPTEYALVTFGERPALAVDFTKDPAAVASAVEGISDFAEGKTHFFDACAFAVAQARRSSRPKQAIVIFSDGMDSRKDRASKEVRRLRDSTDAVIFTVRLIPRPAGPPQPFPPSSPYISPSSDVEMNELAARTGGAYYEAGSDDDLVRGFDWVADQLNHQYTIGFRPSASATKDEYQRLKLRLADGYARQPVAKGLRIRARQGFLTSGGA